ncbi:N-formylglutamate deformylase [Natronohydrobacter thiooxidans]|uniref:N-formylglutamate deformylase n=1 Tax=Natronohydrobacter thiooxidans TaxID=87172 RepID=UPI0008FF379E|nr:N-formylglutamate deformylase [Natronohydrobacter thiooxidans]
MHDAAITGIDLPAVSVAQGDSALVLGVPHGGTFLPDPVLAALNETGRGLSDTDWHMARLISGLVPGATVVAAKFHRYLIDANRDPSGASLYPGQNTTGLVPLTDFDGVNIWDRPPDAPEIEARRAQWHAPYHAALEAELDRVQALHGHVVLFDCHSIRSQIPFLFDGRLPDFNIGTNRGTTCAAELEAITLRHCAQAEGYTHVLNGRFLGGWTTRHYGRPEHGRHAIQLELAQSTYMHESPPWNWDEERAARLRAVLAPLLAELAAWKPD